VSARAFSKALDDFGAQLSSATAKFIELGVERVVYRVKTGSPVKTGWFRSHWKVSDVPDADSVPDAPRGFQSGLSEGVPPSPAEVENAVRGVDFEKPESRFVVNPVRYGEILNLKGGSRIPAHFAERATDAAAADLEQVTPDVFP
jgi:hypothetical protein